MNDSNPDEGTAEQLSVVERVRAAISYLTNERGLGNVSVSDVCKAARVNRASLYAWHRDIVDEIRRAKESARLSHQSRGEGAQGKRDAATKLKQLDSKYRALLLLCLEQQAEIRSLHLQLDSLVDEAGRPRRERPKTAQNSR
jgi:AcrR family transcriptional regulator